MNKETVHIDELPQRCKQLINIINKDDKLCPVAYKNNKKWQITALLEKEVLENPNNWGSKYYRISYN